MLKLMEQIKNDLNNKEISNRIIADKLSVTEQYISKCLNKTGRFSLFQFLDIINFLYENNENLRKKRLLEFFIQTERTDNLRVMLEWTSNNGNKKLFDIINSKIKSIHKGQKKENNFKSLIDIYKVLQKRKSQAYVKLPQELIKDYKSIHVGCNDFPESTSLLNILEIYSLWDQKGYIVIENYYHNAIKYLENIKIEYVKNSHELRLLEVLLKVYVKQNNISKVQSLEESIFQKTYLEEYPYQLNAFYLTLSEFYSMTDYNRSKYYIELAQKISKNLLNNYAERRRVIEATHDFIHIVNGEYSSLFLSSISEKAHFYAKTGQVKKAIELFETIENERDLSNHELYYKALALGDNELMNQARDHFIASGNIFHSCLPNRYFVLNYS